MLDIWIECVKRTFHSFAPDRRSMGAISWKWASKLVPRSSEYQVGSFKIMLKVTEVILGASKGINLLNPSGFFTYHQGSTFKNSTWRSLCVECFVRISEQTATFALYSIN